MDSMVLQPEYTLEAKACCIQSEPENQQWFVLDHL